MLSYRAALENMNYYGDSRVQQSMMSDAYTIKAGPSTAILELKDSIIEGHHEDHCPDESCTGADCEHWWADTYEVATHLEVCGMCRGSGTTVNPSIDAGGISDFDEWDEEDRYNYMNGAYDIPCSTCHGEKVVPSADKMLASLPDHIREAITKFEQDEYDFMRERVAELRMGC